MSLGLGGDLAAQAAQLARLQAALATIQQREGAATEDERLARACREAFEATQALIEAERSSQVILESMAAGLIVQDATGAIRASNPSAQHILGLSPGELEAGTLLGTQRRVVRADGSPFSAAEDPAMETLRTGVPRSGVLMGVHKPDGELAWISVNTRPLPGVHGRASWVVSSFHDVTAFRLAQQRAEQTQAELNGVEAYRNLFEQSPDALVVHDGSAVLDVNPACVRLLGASSREELIGSTPFQFVHPDDREAARSRVRTVVETGHTQGLVPARLMRKDGSVVHVEVTGAACVCRGVKCVQAIVRDVSERMHLEEQLRAAQRLESVGRLAGGLAHDFNNLLSVIITCAELQRESLRERQAPSTDIDYILDAAQRAAALTRQLLAFSRQQVLTLKRFNLNDVVAGMTGTLRRVLGEQVALQTRLAPELCSVRADAGQMEQVIVNLAINARDAMPHGGLLQITTHNADIERGHAEQPELRAGRYAVLSLSDTGQGMDAATCSQIFEPFFTTKKQTQGTGMGLATVDGIVHQSGGHIVVHSVPGRGTSFDVYLPIDTVSGVDATIRATEGAALAGQSTRHELVLVVDDEPALLRTTQRVLAAAGYRVLTAEDGRAALSLCARLPERIDLVLTDIVMPHMGGHELVRALLRERPGLAVLYMSGYSEPSGGRQCVLEPGAHFLAKPFTTERLLQNVRDVLDAAAHGDKPNA